jgi:hypothetical protein
MGLKLIGLIGRRAEQQPLDDGLFDETCSGTRSDDAIQLSEKRVCHDN